ncbi:MAG: alpha-1,2-fucosyltransferase, partial [Lachnospiraceae bacterium]|nr:alpha-1,2-fucosyltransferase [Lachnospiraceae bacterium]
VRYVDNERGELFDLCAMSACRHNIIANSTFSAWAAWLNENEGKIIVYPDKRHGWTIEPKGGSFWPDDWVAL